MEMYTLLTIMELHPEQSQAKHNPELHSGLTMGGQRGDSSAGPHRSGRFGEGLSRRGGQARSFAGTLQAPATLFRFPAPSSSQNERKRENKFRALLFTPSPQT